MADYDRKYSEIVAMAKLEPCLKNIYVEGMSDYFLIKNFLKYHHIGEVGVYPIDRIDVSELYKGMSDDQISVYVKNNKERVILLAQSIETAVEDKGQPIICIVDLDWDAVLDKIRKGRYLAYTDYCSMDIYLFEETTVNKYLGEGIRIQKVEVVPLLKSIGETGRQLFHLHCLVSGENEAMVANDRDITFDKHTFVCSVDMENLWIKTMNKCRMADRSEEMRKTYEERIAFDDCDVRMEVRGHDFVHLLYICTKKMKPNLSMRDEEFGNVFWQYRDLETLADEPLFRRLLKLA